MRSFEASALNPMRSRIFWASDKNLSVSTSRALSAASNLRKPPMIRRASFFVGLRPSRTAASDCLDTPEAVRRPLRFASANSARNF